jgi:hypothetical protein
MSQHRPLLSQHFEENHFDRVLKEALGKYAGKKRPNYQVVPGTTLLILLDGGADDEGAVQISLQRCLTVMGNTTRVQMVTPWML